MPKKRSPSMIPRFGGAAGRRKLLEAICAQKAVADNKSLARQFIAAGSLREYSAEKTIIHQGDSDDDMYMLLCGSVDIIINNRKVAVRDAGNHVGEMALLDGTARRSATILTREKTVVLKLTEHDVTRIARRHPEYWRRLAIEIGARLRERTKFIPEPNSVPMVFIGSSSEALQEATHVSQVLGRHDMTCKLWTQGVFQLSRTTIEELIRASNECDFAVLFLTPDDMTASRGKKKASPRDNVVFELGLFMGALGRDRTYVIIPRGADLKLPTDLLGVVHAPYDSGATRSLSLRLRQVSRLLRQRMDALGPK